MSGLIDLTRLEQTCIDCADSMSFDWDDFTGIRHDCPGAAEILDWLIAYRRSIGCEIERIPFAESQQWSLDEGRAALRHASGRFFAIQGYRGRSNFRPDFWQPLIHQPETGTQGFVIRRAPAGWELLIQARTEPGNVGLVQIGPTIQATYSNYTAAHKGRGQPFLEHFHHPHRFRSRVVIDMVQPELGSRFLKKWNRNIVIEDPTLSNVAHPMFRWVPLTTLSRLMRLDHIVNNDARLVVGLLSLELGPDLFSGASSPLSGAICRSFRATSSASFANSTEAADWLAGVRSRDSVHVDELPLGELPGWDVTADEIRHEQGRYFSVIQLQVHAADREVTDWDQPLIASSHTGEMVLIAKEFDGVLNLLFRAETQIGNALGAELQPTFCDDNDEAPAVPQVIRELLDEQRVRQRFTVEGSDEGGRFFQCITRFDIRWLDSHVHPELPERYAWLTIGQIRELLAGPDLISDESRSILSLFLTAACCELDTTTKAVGCK